MGMLEDDLTAGGCATSDAVDDAVNDTGDNEGIGFNARVLAALKQHWDATAPMWKRAVPAARRRRLGIIIGLDHDGTPEIERGQETTAQRDERERQAKADRDKAASPSPAKREKAADKPDEGAGDVSPAAPEFPDEAAIDDGSRHSRCPAIAHFDALVTVVREAIKRPDLIMVFDVANNSVGVDADNARELLDAPHSFLQAVRRMAVFTDGAAVASAWITDRSDEISATLPGGDYDTTEIVDTLLMLHAHGAPVVAELQRAFPNSAALPQRLRALLPDAATPSPAEREKVPAQPADEGPAASAKPKRGHARK